MTHTSSSRSRDYTFGDIALALRERAQLTQEALAGVLGVSRRAILKWEAGEAYPSADSLKNLIALYVRRGVFTPGRELEEAEEIWEAVRQRSSRLKLRFDARWFAEELARKQPRSPLSSQMMERDRRLHWGDAPDVGAFHGRVREREMLARWVLGAGSRLVAVLGLGGIGKTAFAVTAAHDIASHVDYLYWYNLRNAPPFDDWVSPAIRLFSGQEQVIVPESHNAQLDLLLGLLRARRCLLVLDNFETLLEPGVDEARYREGYGAYGGLLQRMGETSHESCLLLTSREKPPELGPMEGESSPVRTLRLGGLETEEARALLLDKRLTGDEETWRALVDRYGGNPLALKVAAQTVGELFGGDISAFLSYVREEFGAVFGGIQRLLQGQVDRLSPSERRLLYWLAVEREPVGFAELASNLGPLSDRREALEALDGLRRRSLVERGERGSTLTLQPVVLEYATDRLVAEVTEEVTAGQPMLLRSHALVQATSKDYVRRTQERLIATPLLDHLVSTCGSSELVEQRLLDLIEVWRGRPSPAQGYGPGNVANLLRLLRRHLRGLDFSRLHLQEVYLQEVEAQDTSLADAHLVHPVLAEAFAYSVCVSLSADGAHLAAGTSDGEMRVWRVADRTPLLSVTEHRGEVFGLGLSANGRFVASGSTDGTVKLWDVESGACLATMEGHTGAIHGLTLSGDGRLVASASSDGTLKLWDAGSMTCVVTLEGHTGPVWSVGVSADRQLVGSGSYDGTVKLWDAQSGACLATLEGNAGPVWGVAMRPDGQVLVSGGHDGTVRVWDVSGHQCLAVLRGHTDMVFAVAVSADGRLIVSCSHDGTIRVWDAGSRTCSAVLQGHQVSVRSVALSADGQLIASSSFDGTIRLWEVQGGRHRATLQGHTRGVFDVAFSADGSRIASGTMDGTIQLWEVEGGRHRVTLQGHTGFVWGVALSADGRLLVSGGQDGTVRVWDVNSGRHIATLQDHTGLVWCVALSADGRLIASGGHDGMVRVWEASSCACLTVLQGHDGAVAGVTLSDDGQLVASGGFDGTIRVWAVDGGRHKATLLEHTGFVWGVALSADGRLLASGGEDGTVRLWEVEGRRLIATLHSYAGLIMDVALSADGRVVASAGGDGKVRVWETATKDSVAVLEGNTALWGVALSGDGRFVACGGGDGMVRVWEVRGSSPLYTLHRDRPYERMEITGLTGISQAQRDALLALGAIEKH